MPHFDNQLVDIWKVCFEKFRFSICRAHYKYTTPPQKKRPESGPL